MVHVRSVEGCASRDLDGARLFALYAEVLLDRVWSLRRDVWQGQRKEKRIRIEESTRIPSRTRTLV